MSGFINNTIICNEKKQVDLDALNLLASGSLSELCSCSYKNEKKHHHFVYDTLSAYSLAQLQAGMSFENTVDLLSAAASMIRTLRRNALVLDNVKNAKEYIFKADENYRFIYVPIEHKPHLSVRDYLLKLVSVIHHKDARLSAFVKELRKMKDDESALGYLESFVASYTLHYAGFAEEGATSLLGEEGTTILSQDLSGEEGTTILSQASYAEEGTTLLSQDLSGEEGTTILSQSSYDGEGETTVLSQTGYTADVTEYFPDASGEYETTVLTSQPVYEERAAHREIHSEYYLYLVRNINGEQVTVDMTPFTIGKDSYNMDYVLTNDSVSRHHATIIYEDGAYYVMDNHSTNGTIIEGVRLQGDEKGEIDNGYIITLGNESFQAHIERR